MSIRLKKAIRELNITLQTAVDFLQARPEIGEVMPDPSFKVNDRQYAALVEYFTNDATVQKSSEEPFGRQQYAPLGKIDLSGTGTENRTYEEDMNFYFDDNGITILTTDSVPAQITDVYGICIAQGDTAEEAICNLKKSVKKEITNANLILGLRLTTNNTDKAMTVAYGTAARMKTD